MSLFVIRVRSLANPAAPPRWCGKTDKVLALSSPQRSFVGLRGWSTREEAQRAIDRSVDFFSVILGTHDSHEVVELQRKARKP